ncbi:carboxypeptidase-like regulatory domain-containing protein [Hymenobacter cellulosilyticus]|uniref:Carboxypeptidase-like regulatory domain-containing protein n=1 Tax=Hymenobacter cellulosilyticus TaxID=2932248 RepID=A0A8T9QAB6_9BACT|nr:carboxypeptidase-like regulatory domain-containing protein [Hymenobacter cellulosilyticus]UOQ73932.1 carboxypeptidase-like regulatory domain-containing protein [Hymenobacter cellulosilyticus]
MRPLVGYVVDAEGQPLSSAMLLVKGTQNVYITDSEGRFQLTSPVYQKQVLTVESAGYITRLVPSTTARFLPWYWNGTRTLKSSVRASGPGR